MRWMYGGITLLNNASLYDRFTKAVAPQRMELLFEIFFSPLGYRMSRRILQEQKEV